MQINHFLILKKFKNTESAQLWQAREKLFTGKENIVQS